MIDQHVGFAAALALFASLPFIILVGIRVGEMMALPFLGFSISLFVWALLVIITAVSVNRKEKVVFDEAN